MDVGIHLLLTMNVNTHVIVPWDQHETPKHALEGMPVQTAVGPFAYVTVVVLFTMHTLMILVLWMDTAGAILFQACTNCLHSGPRAGRHI